MKTQKQLKTKPLTLTFSIVSAVAVVLVGFESIAVAKKGGGGKPGGGGGGGGPSAPTYQFAFANVPAARDGVPIRSSWAKDTNSHGEIVGTVAYADDEFQFLEYLDSFGNWQTVILNDLLSPVFTALEDGITYEFVSAQSINGNRQITGAVAEYVNGEFSKVSALRVDLNLDVDGVALIPSNLILIRDASLETLYGQDINESGEVLGIFEEGPGVAQRFFKLSADGTILDLVLDVPAGESSALAQSINDQGLVVGHSNPFTDVVWTYDFSPGGGYEILLDGDGSATGRDINNAGVVVGQVRVGRNYRGFRKEPGLPYEDLGRKSRVAYAINDDGIIVGTGDPNLWVWFPDIGTVDLPGQITNLPAGVELRIPNDIGDSGHICGNCVIDESGAITRAFILTPNP